MEIIFHAHHAPISPRLKQRAADGIQKLEQRLGRAVGAVVRVEEDGPSRRVEIVLHAARGRRLVAEGRARYFGPALAEALARLGAQIAHVKRASKPRVTARGGDARRSATA